MYEKGRASVINTFKEVNREDNVERCSGKENKEENIESKEADEKLKSFKAWKLVEKMNKYRI